MNPDTARRNPVPILQHTAPSPYLQTMHPYCVRFKQIACRYSIPNRISVKKHIGRPFPNPHKVPVKLDAFSVKQYHRTIKYVYSAEYKSCPNSKPSL
ncbi:hypothetical protein E4K39_00745 [Neisseria meningitidis]|nr:hypothetical protein A6J53_11970 [Neisseria meningitidis]MBG8584257.1 hypothetical protein [Neisseria meningitidis]MBG8586356.1 hypothetical protein [Neisseria meningitidis]MBG8590786.1 hypothetical protein [Neisseria meningitidis]MBG8599737.1 hypothetical protein [Neisseria meningitidis]